MKKKPTVNDEIPFTPYERRILGISQSEKQVRREAFCLRQIIDQFPGILNAVECDFNPNVCLAFLHKAIADIQLIHTVRSYHTKK